MTKSRDTADILEDVKVDGNVTAVGQETLKDNTGIHNTGVGYRAMFNSSLSGSFNVALGNYNLYANTSGASNTALGYQSLFSNTTASNNTAVGYKAGYANTTGTLTATGRTALENNTTGVDNTATGRATMSQNTTGGYNTAVGALALLLNTTSSNNTAVGYQAGFSATTEGNSVYVGRQAGYNANGLFNTFVGNESGLAVTSGVVNTFVGYDSGSSITTGSKNVIIGNYNGNEGGLDIRTSSNNIVLSDGDGNPWGYRKSLDGTWVFNNPTNAQNAVTVSNTGTGGNPYGLGLYYPNAAPNNDSGRFLTCSDSSAIRLKIFNNGNVVNQNNSYGADSDIKLKENIVDSGSQWDDIKAVSVRKYSLKSDNLDEPNMLGVIAQELESSGMNGLVKEIADIDKDMNDLGTTTKSVNYSILYMKAVKALQEAMARIETLEAKVATLEG